MTSAYLAAIGARLSFMVGVISSPPGAQNTSSTPAAPGSPRAQNWQICDPGLNQSRP